MENTPSNFRKYTSVYFGLLALTVVTVGVSYIKFGPAVAVILALIVAGIKGALVASYFMHLISERRVIIVLLAVTVFLVLFMLIFIFASQYGLPEGVHYVL